MLDLLFGGRNLIVESQLSFEDATARLQREIAEPEWRMFDHRRQLFIGTLTGDRFHISRMVPRQHAFRPTIDGTLSRAVNGCRAKARLKLAPMDLFYFSLLMLIAAILFFFGLQAVAEVLDPVSVTTDFTVVKLLGLLIAPLMFTGPVIVVIVEARKATRMLRTLFQGDNRRIAVAASFKASPSDALDVR
jgi:hypothetical protein